MLASCPVSTVNQNMPDSGIPTDSAQSHPALALSIVVDLVKRATASAGDHSPPRFVFVSPNDPKKPIDGHAFSIAMIRFGNALSVANDAKDCGFDEVRAITTWTLDRPSAHGLRRTLATRLAGSGIPAEDASVCLNHARRSITARHYDLYDRAALGEFGTPVHGQPEQLEPSFGLIV
jgi:integrase